MLIRILISMCATATIILGIILFFYILSKADEGEVWASILMCLFLFATFACGVYQVIYYIII